SVHHIWCPLSSQEFQDLPDGAETTLTLKLTGMVNSIVTEVLREITGQPTEYYTPAKGILLIKQAVY
ncbi:hypothetical protein VC891_26885, partial [Citrobacter freundii]|nr:hypothetical protein [Citrobacter freundii]